jgi:hypothetical protein
LLYSCSNRFEQSDCNVASILGVINEEVVFIVVFSLSLLLLLVVWFSSDCCGCCSDDDSGGGRGTAVDENDCCRISIPKV